MNRRPWVAVSLATVVVALVPPSTGVAAQASARHTAAFRWVQDGDGEEDGDDHRNDRNPWRDCRSETSVILIDPGLRAILKNGRRGPEAIVIQGPSSPTSPTEPWDNFTFGTYLDSNYPTQTSGQYEFAIHDFFRVRPRFEVQVFGRHKREFFFPAADCFGHRDDGDRGDHSRPQGGRASDGSSPSGSPSGSPSPREGESGTGKGKEPAAHGSADALRPPPRGAAAGGGHDRVMSAKQIGVVGGGLLMVLGVLAAVWFRGRRSGR